jgi:putative ABC transport system permease protein
MDTLLSDVRHAFRMLRGNPGFTAVAVLTLALGIGANTAIFGVVNATLLQPLPFPDPDRLMTVWHGSAKEEFDLGILSYPDYRDARARNRVFSDLAILDSAGKGYNLSGGAAPEQVSGVRVTATFFTVLGVPPALGRTFLPEEEEPGRNRVVVLSHGLWKRRYGADASIVGQTIRIDGEPHTVVGVMPEHFLFQFWSGPRQLWVPTGWTRGDHNRGASSFLGIGRLKPGVTLAEARQDLDTIGRALAKDHPESNVGKTFKIIPADAFGAYNVRPALLALLSVVGFVLLIACVNVANLMLARSAARQKELAVRSALGAGRGRIVRQLLTESVVISLLGGLGGLLLAAWGATLWPRVMPDSLASIPLRPMDHVAIDASVLAFTFGVACLAGILFGLVPALAVLRGDLNEALMDNARGSTAGGKSRLRHALVASEVALTLVVLAGAGLMISSVARLLAVDPGLDPRNVLVLWMSQPQEDLYNGPPDHARFCQDLEEHVGGLPGVLSVTALAHLPLIGGSAGRSFTIEGRPEPGPENPTSAYYSVACPNVLRTLGVPLVGGREFTVDDTAGAPGVVLVNEAMARKFWPGEDAVGKRFMLGRFDSSAPWLTVVGVFRDVRHWGLAEATQPSFLRPFPQAGWPNISILVKTASTSTSFVHSVKKALAVIEPNQPTLSETTTMEAAVRSSVASRRFQMMLLSGFAVLALCLAAVGIAGVVGYSVVQRTPEIGIRIALGARGGDILRLVLGRSMAWTLAGIGIGLVAAFGLLRFLRSLLYGVAPTDPIVLGAVSLLLIAVAFAASYLPARRAARVDPVVALRCE